MKIEKFIKELQEIGEKFPNATVIFPLDEEGNGFAPYGGFSSGVYDSDINWEPEFSELDENDLKYKPKECNAICLWPAD